MANNEEVAEVVKATVTPELFRKEYERVFTENATWNAIETTDDALYDFDDKSTYIQNPPFFEGLAKEPADIAELSGLRVIGKFGDSITTDHISPAGAIGKDTPAGKYLLENGVNPTLLQSCRRVLPELVEPRLHCVTTLRASELV